MCTPAARSKSARMLWKEGASSPGNSRSKNRNGVSLTGRSCFGRADLCMLSDSSKLTNEALHVILGPKGKHATSGVDHRQFERNRCDLCRGTGGAWVRSGVGGEAARPAGRAGRKAGAVARDPGRNRARRFDGG